MVLVDTLNIIFITFYMAIKHLRDEGKEFNQENVPFFYHLLIKKLNMFFAIYGKLDFCWEGRRSLEWRRSIYPEYKTNRNDNKEKNEYILLKSTFPKIKELLQYYPCRNIEVDEAEADDIIYQLSLSGSHTILSTDKDLSQIKLINPDADIYNPIIKKYIEPSKTIIEEKAIIGDRSDNIPGIYRIGEKTFIKMMEDKNFFNEKMKGDNLKTYNIFKKIVDLSQLPNDIKLKIIDINNIEKYNEFQPDEIELFYFNNKLVQQIHDWAETKYEIKRRLK
jgi:DNA polymerase I